MNRDAIARYGSEAIKARWLKPLLEDPSILKIGQNLKYELQVFAVRGIEIRAHEDTMLMSYVLDAGRSGHGIDTLAGVIDIPGPSAGAVGGGGG